MKVVYLLMACDVSGAGACDRVIFSFAEKAHADQAVIDATVQWKQFQARRSMIKARGERYGHTEAQIALNILAERRRTRKLDTISEDDAAIEYATLRVPHYG